MCHDFDIVYEPTAVPIRVTDQPDGHRIVDFAALLAKATHYKNGVHQTKLQFPLLPNRWVVDPNFKGDHQNCIHLAPPEAARKGELNSYGSHRVLFLPSQELYGDQNGKGHCWHDHAVYPLYCLDCGRGEELVMQNLNDILRDIPFNPRRIVYPNGRGFLEEPIGNRLWTGRTALKARTVFEPVA